MVIIMALTIQEFGAKIKAKYPQYSDMSDADVGNKMLAKYPEYKDMVETREQKIQRYQTETEAMGGDKAKNFLSKPWTQQLFSKEVFKELPGAIAEVSYGNIAKFGVSALEAPKAALTGKASQRTYDLPGVKPFKSFQSEAETRAGKIIEGQQPLYTSLAPFLEVPLAGLETYGAVKAGQKLYSTVREAKSFSDALKVVQLQTATQLGKKEAIKTLEKSGKAGGATKTITGKIKVVPNKKDIEIANSVKGLVNPKKSPVKNIENINEAISDMSENVVEPLLKTNQTPLKMSELKNFIDETAKPSELIKATNTQKTFDKIKNYMLGVVKENATDNYTLWKARTKIDNAFKKEFGEALYNPNSPAHLPVKEAYSKIRRAINEYISYTTPTTDESFLDLMKELSNMYDAVDNIALKNYKIVGTSLLKRFSQRHPLLTQTAKYGAIGYGTYKVGQAIGIGGSQK